MSSEGQGEKQVSSPNGMTIREVAAYLKLPCETLYKYVRGGKIPARKVGREWVFDREEIDQWVAGSVAPKELPPPSRVLVVDDEPAVRRVFQLWLESAGYHVTEASDGELALEKLHAGTFDLVFLDLMMPNMDGLEALRIIKSLPNPPGVVIVTAHYNGSLMEEVLQLGPAHVLKKPVQREQFLQAAATYLSPNAAPQGQRPR